MDAVVGDMNAVGALPKGVELSTCSRRRSISHWGIDVLEMTNHVSPADYMYRQYPGLRVPTIEGKIDVLKVDEKCAVTFCQ